MSETEFAAVAVGTVHSPLVDLSAAPKQGDEGLDRGDRDVLRVHPRGDADRPEVGVFATRSPDRPNPIGLHRVEVVAVDGGAGRVRDLEAVDGTPVLDVKPILSGDATDR